jgi:uncharacterized membrane-anchored protein YjiN (DUF445 family)
MDLMTDADVARARELRTMKARATGLFVLVTIGFVVARVFEHDSGWIPYARAMCEAAMVGALADWFAVTALFRHPLGIPVPHTAIVPERKDQLGRNLAEFVEANFLSTDVVTEKLRTMSVATRTGEWLRQPANADRVSEQVGAVIRGGLDVLRDDDVQRVIEHAVLARVQRVPLAPTAGRVLELMTADGRHHDLLDAALRGVDTYLREHRSDFRSRFAHESPWWVPESVDDRIFDKIFTALHAFLDDVTANPDHEVRRHLDARIAQLASDLRTDPAMFAKGEEVKAELLAHPAVRSWIESLWRDLKAAVVRQSHDPQSELRARVAASAVSLGANLVAEPALARKVDAWVEGAARHVVDSSRHEIADLITTTVEKWDPDEASRRIELAVGRDLQFIRINGTLVGGLAGLVIYSLGRVIG